MFCDQETFENESQLHLVLIIKKGTIEKGVKLWSRVLHITMLNITHNVTYLIVRRESRGTEVNSFIVRQTRYYTSRDLSMATSLLSGVEEPPLTLQIGISDESLLILTPQTLFQKT